MGGRRVPKYVSTRACGQKTTRGHQVAAFPSLCAPQQDQCGSVADWRPPKSGDQEGDWDPATHGGADDPRCKKSSVWARSTAASKKAGRTGAVYLFLYAASNGRWLLSKARPLPSPLGLCVSCWASLYSSC